MSATNKRPTVAELSVRIDAQDAQLESIDSKLDRLLGGTETVAHSSSTKKKGKGKAKTQHEYAEWVKEEFRIPKGMTEDDVTFDYPEGIKTSLKKYKGKHHLKVVTPDKSWSDVMNDIRSGIPGEYHGVWSSKNSAWLFPIVHAQIVIDYLDTYFEAE